ncbi:DNA-directed RNA polymerase subunit omega [Virgibacillus sp. FSP13]|uniref:DNA-directed RNA polymerase subunit omega n=1 Tax=Lentibacillus sp. Marseille-P4043 TaxID=2040293 RepID=UPI002D799DF4|nr:DNA-directed RNA polymerase subunit omega [Lentibacillus sp. Marseille-P4043]
MMLDPSIDALQEKIRSKYTLVTLSARRAREMRQKKNCQVENPKSAKFVGMALEEIQAEKLFVKE